MLMWWWICRVLLLNTLSGGKMCHFSGWLLRMKGNKFISLILWSQILSVLTEQCCCRNRLTHFWVCIGVKTKSTWHNERPERVSSHGQAGWLLQASSQKEQYLAATLAFRVYFPKIYQETGRWHTDRLGGLQRSGGERVPAAAALGAEVGRGGGRVVDERQDVVVPPLLFCSVCIVAVRRRGAGVMTICNRRKPKFSNFFRICKRKTELRAGCLLPKCSIHI